MTNQNVFAGAFVDRSGHRREDPDWLSAAIGGPDSKFLPVWRDKCLTFGESPRISLLDRSDVAQHIVEEETIFLGLYEDQPAFALPMADSAVAPFDAEDSFHDLRYLGSVLPADESNLAAHAIALINWHRLHRFCTICGSSTRYESGGNTRICENATCSNRVFPRVDPAIIVLVSRRDQCLLGRQGSWPEGRFSTIAGFVEPGESLEDAVRREVQEETDIRVGSVHYHSSQPWPFPSSLMLGFTASAESDDIHLNDGELEDARWFSRKELRSGFPKLPYRLSIARRLVDNWLIKGT
ncbi:MAG: NAD(+) diphosphatase [Woeseiaceae bacterium]